MHYVVDEHSRSPHAELQPREDAETNARMLEPALADLAAFGLGPPEA